MTHKDRKAAKKLALQYILKDRPLEWFEEIYKAAEYDADYIPWADLTVNPNLKEWIESKPTGSFKDKRVLIVGCGLGDDSEYWTKYSNHVEAFDISATAIDWCKRRFPASTVNYFQDDITNIGPRYYDQYDVVQESYTLQVLPFEKRQEAIRQLPLLLRKEGILLVICRGREEEDFIGDMPFPLTMSELAVLSESLGVANFENYFDNETPRVRRFRIEYQKH
jgi:SAM-dependent methyltransferase